MNVVQDLAGKHAVVTGAGRGLGLAIAERLARSGAAITAIDLEGELAELPDSWKRIAIDLVAANAQDRLAEAAAGHESVDIIVANAGSVPPWRPSILLIAQNGTRS